MPRSQRLARVNSAVHLEPHVAEVGPRTIAALVAGCALVIDGTDNFRTRHLLNERGYRYPLLLPGCTGCKACSQICPDYVFQVYRFETPQLLPVSLSEPAEGANQ